jgi:2-methylcitrate dehydratase PrpD
MGLGSLKYILKVEIIRTEQEKQNKTDEDSSLQYACAVAVLK